MFEKIKYTYEWVINFFKHIFRSNAVQSNHDFVTAERKTFILMLDTFYRIDHMLLSASMLWTNAHNHIVQALPENVNTYVTSMKQAQAIENLLEAQKDIAHLQELFSQSPIANKEASVQKIRQLYEGIEQALVQVRGNNKLLDLATVKTLHKEVTELFNEAFSMKLVSTFKD